MKKPECVIGYVTSLYLVKVSPSVGLTGLTIAMASGGNTGKLHSREEQESYERITTHDAQDSACATSGMICFIIV